MAMAKKPRAFHSNQSIAKTQLGRAKAGGRQEPETVHRAALVGGSARELALDDQRPDQTARRQWPR